MGRDLPLLDFSNEEVVKDWLEKTKTPEKA